MDNVEFVKLIRFSRPVQLSNGDTVVVQRYMDIDGCIIAEAVEGQPYPSSLQVLKDKLAELEQEAEDAKTKRARQVKAEQDAQAEWEQTRQRMIERLKR